DERHKPQDQKKGRRKRAFSFVSTLRGQLRSNTRMDAMLKLVCAIAIVGACAAAGGARAERARAQTAAVPPAADVEKLFGVLSFVRDRNARDYAITTSDGIDEGRYVEIGGIEQWITNRGEHRAQTGGL